MSKNEADEPTIEPQRTLSNKDWDRLLQALKKIADNEKENEQAEQQRFKDEQKRFHEEKKIWRTEKWLLIANLAVSALHLLLAIFKLVKIR